LHPQGCQILSLDPLLFGFNHMPVNWCIRQDSHLQTLRSKRRMIIISPRMRKWSRWRDSHSRGAMRPAVYETAAVAAEPHRRNGGSPRCCPVLCGLRDRCIAAMLATRMRHEGGSRRGGSRGQSCDVLADTGFRVARKWTSIRVARPVFRFGRPACISQHLCSKKWPANHSPLD
jgi:hypothetical protein